MTETMSNYYVGSVKNNHRTLPLSVGKRPKADSKNGKFGVVTMQLNPFNQCA